MRVHGHSVFGRSLDRRTHSAKVLHCARFFSFVGIRRGDTLIVIGIRCPGRSHD